jgi:hypothetical protein
MMGLSLAFGRNSVGQPVQSSYRATQELVGKFGQEFGARNCNDLLGCDLGTPEGQAMFHDNKLHERCARYTARAAEIAASLIADARV